MEAAVRRQNRKCKESKVQGFIRADAYVILLSMNTWQLPGTRCSWAIAGLGKFTKLVYESKFRKRAEGMSFVNLKPATFSGLGKQDFEGSGEVQIVPRSSGFRSLT